MTFIVDRPGKSSIRTRFSWKHLHGILLLFILLQLFFGRTCMFSNAVGRKQPVQSQSQLDDWTFNGQRITIKVNGSTWVQCWQCCNVMEVRINLHLIKYWIITHLRSVYWCWHCEWAYAWICKHMCRYRNWSSCLHMWTSAFDCNQRLPVIKTKKEIE